MLIAGLEKCSFLDYPSNIAAVVFTAGCNMDCFYCHNRHIIGNVDKSKLIAPDKVLAFLRSRIGLLDGVVISGGEPTIQHGLESFIVSVKALGFRVKLDTNGSNPEILKSLIDKNLLDYVAMDIKAPIDRYGEFAGTDKYNEKILESIKVLSANRVNYHFRTTMAPGLDASDVEAIRSMIGDAPHITQTYRKP